MKILFYILLFMFAYRIMKKLFLPAYPNKGGQHQDPPKTHFNEYSNNGRSNIIEDVDYEEVD